MTVPFASIDIIPETDTIHLFTGENVIPSEAYTLRGFVELKLMRPLKVRRISVRFKGIIRSIISNEMLKHAEPPINIDSNDSRYWPANFFHPRFKELPLTDRVALRAAYIAMGYNNARRTILSESLHVLDPEQPVLIEEGTSRWPFELVINNANKLPPSILLPRHLIIYELSAQLQLASLGESIKLAYWNATVSFAHLSSPSFRHALVRRRSSTSSAEEVSLGTVTENASKPAPACRVYKPIKVLCHDFASLQLLRYEPRIRYRGCRQNHMRYEVSIPSFVCLQQQKLELTCKFERLREEARISLVEVYLEQLEKYPLRTDALNNEEQERNEVMVTRTRQLCRVRHVGASETNTTDRLAFKLDLTTPQTVQDVDTQALKITHKVRMVVYFVNNVARRMSLSFPVKVGTVPPSDGRWSSIAVLEGSAVRQAQFRNTQEDAPLYDKLPSYHDVLREGPPPAAFLDDDLSHHPSVHI